MTLTIIKSILAVFLLLYSACTLAATETNQNLCSELSPLMTDSAAKIPNPARSLTKQEQQILESANLELLQSVDYSNGAVIVDTDNDGVDDLLVWSIQGSGRFTYAEVYGLPSGKLKNSNNLTSKYSLDLGVLSDPRLISYRGQNLFVYSNAGDSDNLVVSRVKKRAKNLYEKQTICSMQITLKVETSCSHPACKELQETIQNKDNNTPFVNVEWPHKYLFPAGVEAFYSSDWSTGDFDNSGNKSVISRFGRRGYIYQNIYWKLLGLDIDESQVAPQLQPEFDSNDEITRSVLPGAEHDRLRKTLQRQSVMLSESLKQTILLPQTGEFFLFNANKGRTYWAWDFDEAPYGRELHIVYSNSKKSDYIGLLKVSRNQQLTTCKKQCNISLNK